MTKASVYCDRQRDAPLDSSENPENIAALLAAVGIGYEHWPTRALPADADEAAIVAAYAPEIARLERRGAFRSRDVLRVGRDCADPVALRTKFLEEHTHADAEVRFFAEGGATFYFHVEGKVIELICGAGDLIDVPGGARHWFDAGKNPCFTLLRFFPGDSGWEATFTGDPIARKFVDLTA